MTDRRVSDRRSEGEVEVEVAVTVLGGYLGAGKTTLLNHLLRTAEERIAVLVNDFGAINVDESLIEAADDDKISLANGCICCSLVDGFAAALRTVLDLADPPPRLVIEASGVADPAQVAAYGHGPGLRLDGVVVVVDVETIVTRLADDYVGDTVAAQLRAADLVLLNKVDLVDDVGLDRARSAVAGHNGRAGVVEATMGALPIDVVLGPRFPSAIAGRPMAGRPAAGQPAAEPTEGVHPFDGSMSVVATPPEYRTDAFRVHRPADRTAMEAWLNGLPAEVLRAKGVIELDGRSHIVQHVGGRWTIQPTSTPFEGPGHIVTISVPDGVDPGAPPGCAPV